MAITDRSDWTAGHAGSAQTRADCDQNIPPNATTRDSRASQVALPHPPLSCLHRPPERGTPRFINRRTKMPFPYDPTQLRFPGDQWPRDGAWDPSLANTPFSLSPEPPPSTTQGATDSDHFGSDNPVVQAQFLRGAAARAAGAAGGGSTLPPVSTPGTQAWWWDQTKRGHQGLADFTKSLIEGIFAKGFGGNGIQNRCIRAASGEPEDWEEFCRDLEGAGSSRSDCWSKVHEPSQERRNWCYSAFGD